MTRNKDHKDRDTCADIHVHEHQHGHAHMPGLWAELIHHLPYAIFSVAFSLIILSFVSYFSKVVEAEQVRKGAKMLFHSFHFMHIVFAATGSLLTFFRFSAQVLKALIVGMLSTMTFCTLSDSVLPYLGGTALGVKMSFHICFLTDLGNVLPFLFIGLLNGWVMSRHHAARQGFYSLWSHFFHIFVSSIASSFYLVAHGFGDWYKDMGYVFLFLIVAVVIPCTLADVVVPMTFALAGKKHEKHTPGKN